MSERSAQFEITNDPIDVLAMEKSMRDPSCGALVTFFGIVRNHTRGKQVTKLEYEAHAPMARKVFEEIASESHERFHSKNMTIVHRVGALAIGDVAVWIGVMSPHRAQAFEACRYAIDELKKRAPIWKKEYFEDSTSQWVESCDHA